MFGWLSRLVLDKRAREALVRPATAVPPRPAAAPRERTPAEALAQAEERMKRLPPEKAQLIRSALLIHRARQGVLGELSDDERAKLEQVARKTLLGGG